MQLTYVELWFLGQLYYFIILGEKSKNMEILMCLVLELLQK